MSKYRKRAHQILEKSNVFSDTHDVLEEVLIVMCQLAEEVESNLYTGEDITELQAQYQAERLSLYTKEQLKEAFEAGREMHVSDTWDTWRYLTFEDYLKQINNGNNSSVLSE